jgi:hypothetical protein
VDFMSQPHALPAPGCPRGRQPISTGVIAHLNVEWAALTSLDPGEATVHAWARVHPALAGADSLDGLVQRITTHTAGSNDSDVAALIALAQDGDQLAQRTLIQALLGCATRLAARTVGHADDLETARCQVLSAFCQAIHAYRLQTRTQKHVAGLELDALRTVTRRPRTVEQIPAGLQPAETYSHHIRLAQPRDCHPSDPDPRKRWWDTHPAAPALADEGELAHLLRWATDQGVLTATNATILRRMYGPARTTTSARIGADLGLPPGAVRERARTAIRQLRRAVQTHLGDHASLDIVLVSDISRSRTRRTTSKTSDHAAQAVHAAA